jgi:hypothetical protein
MHNLYGALQRLKFRVLSLNYNGYFTRTVHEELRDDEVLGLILSVRLHNEGAKFHYYGQSAEKSSPDQIKINEETDFNINELERALRRSFECFESDESEKSFEPKYGTFTSLAENYVDIPLWTYKCADATHPFYYSKNTECLSCSKTTSVRELRGVIRLYTKFNKDKFTHQIATSLPYSKMTLIQELVSLFVEQEEPKCFSKDSASCSHIGLCRFHSNCSLQGSSANANNSGKKHAISPADPDEVIYQLQKKVLALLGPSYVAPIMLLDSDIRYKKNENELSKILKYRAVDHYSLQTDHKKFINTCDKDNLKTKAINFDEEFSVYYSHKYKGEALKSADQVNGLFQDENVDEELARNLLRNAVQESTMDITRTVWETWMSYTVDFNSSEGSNLSKSLAKGTAEKDHVRATRNFAEGLFFTGDTTVVTPIDYYGQKIGIIFTFISGKRKMAGVEDDDVFKQLAQELSPDLFYSLEYEMYDKALNALEDKSINDVPDILLSVFPQFLNLEAGAFWTKKQIMHVDSDIKPKFCCKFHLLAGSEKIYTFSPCANRENDSCDGNCLLEKDIGEICKHFPSGNGASFSLHPVVCESKIDDPDKIHNIKCRLLVPVQHKASANGDTESENKALDDIDGVFDLCFDLSEFVIRRYAIDLFREINFIYTLLSNAAGQKYKRLRHGTKNAVSAIMGRNMSHNIGSHVLARYSAHVHEDRSETDKRKYESDHRADFLRYLQRRMDFIAEVATTDKSSWSQSLELKTVLNILNYEYQRGQCYEEKSDLHAKEATASLAHRVPILLRYITGKNDLTATVEFTDGQDLWFSCPGGEVGVHALYVILENIIRNSARHGNGHSGNTVTVTVKAEQKDKYIKLTIIDLGTKLEVDGRPVGSTVTPEQARKENAEVAQGKHSRYVDGKRQKRLLLPNIINSILKGEPFIYGDGNPNPHNWGVREMQICATYLRSIPLGDLYDNVLTHAPYILEAKTIHHDGNGEYHLAYELYLQPARRCAFVTNDWENEIKPDEYKLSTAGFSRISVKDKSDDQRAEELRGYEFALIDEGLLSKIKPEILPIRTLKNTEEEIKKKIKSLLNNGGAVNIDAKTINGFMAKLHEEMTKSYQAKHDKWTGKNVNSVFYWDLKQNLHAFLNPIRDPSIASIEVCECSHRNVMVEKIDGEPNAPDRANLNLAWLDHASDDLFKKDERDFGSTAMYSSYTNRPWHFFEIFDSQSLHKPLIEATFNVDDKGRAALCELRAAALARVAVIDERIQSSLGDIYRSDLKLGTLWPCMGIWVPRVPYHTEAEENQSGNNTIPRCNLDKPHRGEIVEFLKKPAPFPDDKVPDFLVIHLTILERIKETNADRSVGDAIRKIMDLADLNYSNTEVVLVTGRGIPALSRDGSANSQMLLRYLPISALLEHLVARPSKVGLMRALWSAAAVQYS